MSHRLTAIFDDLDCEREHAKRIDRITRSEEMYAAACDLALEHGLTLTCGHGMYTLASTDRFAWFFPVTNVIRYRHVDDRRSSRMEFVAEIDVYDFVQLFSEGAIR